ncbi:hypothetical protein PRZ48_007914 [Zasmidium cellare]|uniref:Uncharacterized protein n=1 Tax=Zasmidium cellare TaxID=395010 RepID=A0ABR0EEU4_ZASCE|nr:hypothetical protein PRZ48_007914 [Zasmidium cellare]
MSVSSKRVGLDKALFQVEQAVERASSGEKRNEEDEAVVKRLRTLLGGLGSSEDSPGVDYANEEDNESGETNGAFPDHTPLSGDGQAIESAESPLQLLAASHRASRQRSATSKPKESSKLGTFFSPAQVKLDVGDDIDPITLGLVSEEEADSLMTL